MIDKTNFWTDPDEQAFLLGYIEENNCVNMLEWGSGHSTLILQDKVERLTSVEHHPDWYAILKSKIGKNVDYMYIPPNNPLWEQQFHPDGKKNPAGDDGSFEDFASYVLAPSRSMNASYDVVFIDGRARVACAWAAMHMLSPEGKIFIHDFGPEAPHPYLHHRTYYDVVSEWLEPVGRVKTMACFRIRK